MSPVTTTERGGDHRLPGSEPPPPVPRRRRGPRGRRSLLLAVAALAITGFGGWALYFSDWLRIERVSVHWTGEQRELAKDQILGTAAVPAGSPMAGLDKSAVRERLLTEHPRLKSVQVVRAWPHGVGLKVTEREPEVLLPSDGGYIEVDATGVPFADVDTATADVPVLEMELEQGPGLRRFDEDRVREAAVTVAAALPVTVHRDTRIIRVRSYDSITLELTGNRTVLWGSPEDPKEKAEALVAVLKARGGAKHFDVSVPSAPAASGG